MAAKKPAAKKSAAKKPAAKKVVAAKKPAAVKKTTGKTAPKPATTVKGRVKDLGKRALVAVKKPPGPPPEPIGPGILNSIKAGIANVKKKVSGKSK